MGWICAVIGGACGVALLMTLTLVVVRRLEQRRAAEVLARFAGQEILGMTSNALCLGRRSDGPGRLRGNGVLLLTPDQLYFQLWAPRREVSIPLSRLRAVTTPRSHLGKTSFRPLLKIEYTNSAGDDDWCAWRIRNLETWRAALDRLIALGAAAAGGRGGSDR